MMLIKSIVLSASLLIPITAMAEQKPLETVPYVDLEKYMGVWYEIASYPQVFSTGCVNSQATYTLRSDQNVDVLNECWKGSPTGPRSEAKGIARVVDDTTHAKLKVQFFPGKEGDYWIIDLDHNYQVAVVSEPGRSALWILSRTKSVSRTTLDPLLKRLQDEQGFDTSKLKWTRM